MRRLCAALCFALVVVFSAAQAQAADLVVSAAASLTNALSAAAKKYEAKYPGEHVILNFSSAGNLIRQIQQGAPADVFCAADQQFMNLAEKKGLIVPGTRRNFVQNVMVLVLPAGSKLHVKGLRDLAASPKVQRIALCNLDTTPLGREIRRLSKQMGIWDKIQPKLVIGQTVRQVLEYIVRGEVDAGFIFATDAMHAGMKVQIVKTMNAGPFLFPAAEVKGSKHAAAARNFVAFISGPEGWEVFHDYGFMRPKP